MNIRKNLDKSEKINFMLNLLPLISKVKQLTSEEIELITHTYSLPDILMKTPFSSSSRRLLKESIQMTDQRLSKLIGQIKDKGYLIEEHGEKVLKDPIRKAIEYILKDQSIITIEVKAKETKEE